MSLIWAFWCRTGSGGRLLLVMGGGESIVGGGDASRSPRVADCVWGSGGLLKVVGGRVKRDQQTWPWENIRIYLWI